MRQGTPQPAPPKGKPGKPSRPIGPAMPRSRPVVAVIKWLFALGVLGAVLAVGTAAFIFWMYGRDPSLPDFRKLGDYHPKQVTTITDVNDKKIGEIFTERRTVVAFDKVPTILVDSFVAAEDNKFWTHGGVDYFGMFRALVTNLRSGRTRQGASTITQQVIKGLLLTPERTFKRKIEEIILARRIETSLTKQEILTLYMNQINFGHARYGVEEAAKFYFGKHVWQVNTGEAALLAGLPQSPENISPRHNPKRAKERQTYVLNQLVVMGKITVAEAQKWIDAPIQIVPLPKSTAIGAAWADAAKNELIAQNAGKAEALDSLGTTVRTTLDSSMQDLAQKALQHGLQAIDKRHGIGRPERSVKPDKVDAEVARLAKRLPHGGPIARGIYDAVVTEVFDDDNELAVDLGDYKAAIVLGDDADARFNPPDGDGKTRKPSDRFKPGDVVSVTLPQAPAARKDDEDDDEPKAKKGPKHAKRRVAFTAGPEGAVVIIDVKSRKVRAMVGGYSLKAGGFDRAMQAHRQPGSSFKPIVYATAIDSGKYTPATIINDVVETFRDFPKWRPKNYETGHYEGPVRLRYALSKSINTVSLQLVNNVHPEAVVDMAKRLGVASPLTPELSIALGSNEVTPLELTNAETTLAAGGITAPPQFIDAVGGKAKPAVKGEQVVRPEVAYVVLDMMRSVVTEGTAIAAAVLKIPISGKTGTSNDAKDTWFMGLTPDLAIGVWVGYDDNRPMGHETGGSAAVPVYVEIMKQLSPPAKSFARPPHVVELTIDKKTGLVAADGAPKGTTMSEVFVEGTAPTEVAPLADDITEDNKTKGEYEGD